MANKFILVPEQNYRGLLNKRSDAPIAGKTTISDDLDEQGNFNFVKKKLGAAQSKKRKNLSTKNILYNQWLQNYLRMRRQLVNKPVKVEVTEVGPKILLKSKKAAANDTEKTAKALINEKGELEPILDPVGKPPIKPEIEAEPALDFAEAKSEKSLSTARSPITKSSSTKIVLTEPVVAEQAYKKDGTPLTSRRMAERQRKAAENEKKIVAIEDKLYRLIMNDPSAFGVTPEEEIINPQTGNPVRQSHLKRSIVRLIEPSVKNAPSPPGLKFLKSKLLANEQTRRLLEWKTTESPTTTNRSQQKGSGRKKKVRFAIPFKPSKWGKRALGVRRTTKKPTKSRKTRR